MSQITSRTFKYVDQKITPYLNCEECNLPVYNGKYHSVCNHFKCNTCDTTEHKCQTPDATWYPLENNNLISEILNKLQVVCLYQNNGCSETFPRSGYANHISKCGYKSLVCANCTNSI